MAPSWSLRVRSRSQARPPLDRTKFAASTSEIADLGRSWMGAVYKRMTKDVPQTRKNEYMAETVVVYTDDEGPDSAMFSAHYPEAGGCTSAARRPQRLGKTSSPASRPKDPCTYSERQ